MARAGAQAGYNGSDVAFPKKYVNFTAFIAEHGSAADATKPGFRVAAVRVTNGKGISLSHVNFASSWVKDGMPWGEQSPSLWPQPFGLVFGQLPEICLSTCTRRALPAFMRLINA